MSPKALSVYSKHLTLGLSIAKPGQVLALMEQCTISVSYLLILKNEDSLKKCIEQYIEKIEKEGQRYQALKAHAEEKLKL